MDKHETGVAPERPLCQPISRHGPKTYLQVINLFQFYGLPAPPVKLRDEVVIAFEWAWYGQALDAALSPLPSPGNAESPVPVHRSMGSEPVAWTTKGNLETLVSAPKEARYMWGLPSGKIINVPLYAAPPADKMLGWQTMDSAPKDGAPFVAIDVSRHADIEHAYVYRWEGHPNYWHCRKHGICIRPEYQERYRWFPLPALSTATEGSGDA